MSDLENFAKSMGVDTNSEDFKFMQETAEKLKATGIQPNLQVPDFEKERNELIKNAKTSIQSISDLAKFIKNQIILAKENLIPEAIYNFTLPDIEAICDEFIKN